MCRPRNVMWPDVGRCTPAMVLKSVVLPAPFGPIKPVIVRSRKVNDTPSTARSPPNSLTSSPTSSMHALLSLSCHGAPGPEPVVSRLTPPPLLDLLAQLADLLDGDLTRGLDLAVLDRP